MALEVLEAVATALAEGTRLGTGRGSRAGKQDGLWRELGGKSHRIWQLAAGRVGEGGEERRVTQSFPPG